ncbi:MAG: alanine racemase [Chthonomonadales bacterium]|nr:alanine racemase [Chthonomonadales bacterium]
MNDSTIRAWAEIDLSAVLDNLASMRAYVSPASVLAVVKGDAYGHSIRAVAPPIAARFPDAVFGVASAGEAAAVRSLIPQSPILILGPCLPDEAASIIEMNASTVLSDIPFAQALNAAALRANAVGRVHIEIDTGMGRHGVVADDALTIAEYVATSPALQLDGIMTHFSDAERDREWTGTQLLRFRAIERTLQDHGIHARTRHACNTAAMLLYPEMWFEMVRPGLGLYGILPELPPGTDVPHLRPALALRARVLLVRTLQAGAFISYGRTVRLRRRSRIAVLGIGYADGIPRELGNRGSVLIRGKRVPIIGRICMDVTLADVTDLDDVAPGEIATVIGSDGAEVIRVEEIARLLGTTEHEITTRLGARAPRRSVGLC